MTIEKSKYGQWCISDIVDGYLVQRQYYGHTKKQAIMLFRAEIYYNACEQKEKGYLID